MQSKFKILSVLLVLSHFCFSQIPILNSYPSITNKVVYLDFDGQKVIGTNWNSGNLIQAAASSKMSSPTAITEIWKRISEDYRPFDVNITTDSMRFNNAPPNRRIRVVITPTSAWYGSAGGVAYVGSFTWGGTPGTPCWVFENQLSNSNKNIAEAASHEVGHTLSLRHQSTYSAVTCSKTAEYNPGIGTTGMITWAPIMGVGYSKNVTTWFNGKSATSCTLTQNDHGNGSPGLTGPNFLSFLPDDVGNTPGASKILNLSALNLVDSGLISQPTDIDAYQFTICNNRHVTIDVKPWALDTTNYTAANLDVKLFLYNSANTQLAVDTPLTRLNSRIAVNLAPGTYWFSIDGGGSGNYSDYGSLGKYYLRIKATNPPSLVSAIVTASSICAGVPSTLSYMSNGTPTQWLWTVTGPSSSNSYTVQNPNVAFAAGVHTLSLLASSTASPGCPTTMTINVNSPPNLIPSSSVAGSLCPGKSTTLMVTGASSYTWLPGGFSGSMQIVSPATSITYTINGSNGTCQNTTVIPVAINPDFTITASASASRICMGESITLTTGGNAASFTINPGGHTTSPVTVFPTSSAPFVVIGQTGNCTKSAAITVTVSNHFDVNIASTDTSLCLGSTATLTAGGASNYTFNPGGMTANVVTVSPAASTIYTITGKITNNACVEYTTVAIVVKECNLAGIKEERSSAKVKIYPNPSHGLLTIEGDGNDKKVEIINSIGQVIVNQKLGSKAILLNTEAWARGVYFVKVSAPGEGFYTAKVIVE